MNSIIKHLSIATRLLGSEVAEAALSANVKRDAQLDVNLPSLQEVLQSHGYENRLDKRALLEIPSLAVPVVAILANEEAVVIAEIEGRGSDREYLIYQGDAPAQKISHRELDKLYLGYCWFIKQKVAVDVRSELPEYSLPKA